MPEYLAPGVTIEEIERGPRPIDGVPTSTAAFLGETERGPIKPRLITSYIEYKRWFGDVFGNRDKYMPYAANGFFENGGRRLYVCRIVSNDATSAEFEFGNFVARAVGAGEWGNRIFVKVRESSTATKAPGTSDPIPVGFRLQIAYWANEPDGGLFDPFDPDNRTLRPRPTLVEDFDDLVLDAKSSDYFEKRLVGNSSLIAFTQIDPADATLPAPGLGTLAGGDNGTEVGADDFTGLPADERTEPQGLTALELDPYREVALVYAPFPSTARETIHLAVISHCENMRFRFGVIDSERDESNLDNLDPRSTLQDTQYAAFYYPWIQVADPQSGALKHVPPGGNVLGIYARTDTERGVFKAPANETVRGAVELRFDINDRAQEVLNPRGVNAIRSFPGRGIRVWGARTLSSNGLWKYVSVRRLFIFLERSIYEGTQWVVFEPNDDRLWARVTDTVRLFLRTQWRNGALFGRTEKEAFFITCDRTTMTQDDILNGRLICEIGIAPVRPAEFVIFRIFQHTAEAQR
ncbi:phage tail sheath family protein [Microvirga splendida]|uniref:Phage tail sheath family protein n=1 Tax=Microvirga splendida TaxID=2795727 RepID=A0ABS0Y553_9HYPH|nr:phage tail sheath family protein [Microvirga splendida]MBJ6127185.1 phage tail sheath family protein [Microvirga splendida]